MGKPKIINFADLKWLSFSRVVSHLLHTMVHFFIQGVKNLARNHSVFSSLPILYKSKWVFIRSPRNSETLLSYTSSLRCFWISISEFEINHCSKPRTITQANDFCAKCPYNKKFLTLYGATFFLFVVVLGIFLLQTLCDSKPNSSLSGVRRLFAGRKFQIQLYVFNKGSIGDISVSC